MRSIDEFLADLKGLGIKLWIADNGHLGYDAPKGALTPTIRDELIARKEEMLVLLHQAHIEVPTVSSGATSKTAYPTDEPFPLTYGQQALWFIYEMDPNSATYNVAMTLHIQSTIEIVALRRALQALIERHPALRMTFSTQKNVTVQQVHRHQDVDFRQIDASLWDWDERLRQVEIANAQPFDLMRDSGLRVRLFTHDAADHILLLTMHHIVVDDRALTLLLHELPILYDAETIGHPLTLAPLPATYQDYVRWESDMLAGTEGERLSTYWRKQLAGDIPVLNLPTDYPRPPVQSYNGASCTFELSPTLSQQLKALAKAEGTTLFTTLLACFHVLLYRYSGQEDICVGSPNSTGRTRPEFADVMGYMLNPIVLRFRLSTVPTFRTLLAQTRRTVLDALDHQDYPFPLLVKLLQPRRDPSYSPLFQVMFNLQSMGMDSYHNENSSLVLVPLNIAQQEAQFDLTLVINEGEQSLTGTLSYNTDLFKATTIERMVGNFQTLLSAIVVDLDQSIDTLPLLTAAERHQLLVTWNEVEQPFQPHCLHQLVEAQVARTPQATAVCCDSVSITYQELNERANQLAHYLMAAGVGAESLVGICLERSLEMVVGLLGILKAGGAYVPLDPSYPETRLKMVMADSDVAWLLTSAHSRTNWPRISRIAAGRSLICLNNDWSQIATHATTNPINQVQPTNLAYVIYTSGSTGKPKGVMTEHRAINNRLLWMQRDYPLDETDKVLQKTVFAYDASIWEIFVPLLAGSQLIIANPDGQRDSSYLIDMIMQEGITTLEGSPALYRILLEDKRFGQCTSLRRIYSAGEALPMSLARQILATLDTELVNTYGPTEAAIDASHWVCQPDVPYQIAPIGRPIANMQLYILDEKLQPLPIGVPGELHIGGIGLARGYLNRPELTAQKFIAHPFRTNPAERLYKTGDLVRYLPDGNIEFLGRLDFQVKIRGYRVELGEIESALHTHATVQEATVIDQEEKTGHKRLVAYIVPRRVDDAETKFPPKPLHTAALIADLRTYLKQKLPEYMLPAAFVMLDALPLSPSGKVDRKALPAPEPTAIARSTNFVPPQTETEMRLTAVWSNVLNIKQIGVHDNFFELGGHSLLVAQVRNQLQELFKRSLSIVTLFQYPTIYTLAQYFDAAARSKTAQPTVQSQAKRRIMRRANMKKRRQRRQAQQLTNQ